MFGKHHTLAERMGFEPTRGCPLHDFQSCRFGRSRTSPPVMLDARRPRIGTIPRCQRERHRRSNAATMPPGRARRGACGALYPKPTHGGLINRLRPGPNIATEFLDVSRVGSRAT